ncbi:MAG: MFS transporter [Eubacteriaceae bacterium]|nr:MFS transporter [Eubacteriaceae bacterium]
MTEQKRSISNSAIWAYALTSAMQTFTIMTPYMYGTMFMTTYLGISMATMGTIFLVAKFMDFIICMASGAVIESANFKKGKYLPIIELFRWTVTIGALGQMLPIGNLPMALKFTIISISYIMMHGSMNFLSTANTGLIGVLAGGNYSDRIAITQRNSQISAGVSILRSFGTVPLITLLGKLLGKPELGYTVYTIFFIILYIACTFWLAKEMTGKEQPRDPNAPRRVVKIKDMLGALTGNDQLVVYLVWQIVIQLGTQIVSVIGIYYWTLVMVMSDGSSAYLKWYSIGMGLNTCAGFVYSLFIPKLGVKLGKLKSLFFAQYGGWVAYILYWFLGLKSVYWMTAIGLAVSAVRYLQMGFGANYVLDIGEYGYYKTGKDYRAVVTAFTSVPMKLTAVIGGAIAPYFLSFIGFDKFNQANLDGTLDRNSAEFMKFQKQYMAVYCFVPLACSVIGFLIFKKFYKITDDKAVFYAQENAKKTAEAAKAAPAK